MAASSPLLVPAQGQTAVAVVTALAPPKREGVPGSVIKVIQVIDIIERSALLRSCDPVEIGDRITWAKLSSTTLRLARLLLVC